MTALLFDTFTGRLRLEGRLTTRTALHIGAGGGGDLLGTDLPVVRDGVGRPYIPGSSLKGVLRSAAEALFHGAPFAERVPRPPLSACRIMAGLPCISHERVKEIRKEKDGQADINRLIAETVWEESCSVCRLFGSLEIASRVRFPDLPLVGELPAMELRNGVGIDRDKGLAAPGVLYDFEAVPPGTSFRLTVLLDNPDDVDAGLLLYLFHELDQGNLALGGKASRGLGLVQVEWESVVETRIREENPFASLLSSQDLLKSVETRQVATAETGSPTPALPTTGDPAAWQALADLLRQLPVVDKGSLGERAAPLGLTKAILNEKLGLGLTEARARKPWDHALSRLVECGFLIDRNGDLVLAERAATEESELEETAPKTVVAFQEIIDRFVGALGRRWQEAC